MIVGKFKIMRSGPKTVTVVAASVKLKHTGDVCWQPAVTCICLQAVIRVTYCVQIHFTRVDLMRVLIERNQYKERLIDLQDAVRRADAARAAAKEQMALAAKPTKKRSSVWGL